jgi:PIN domain nuclease of toxin-antitoxin system
LRLLLDTHALLWWLADDPRLSSGARQAIQAAVVIFVSAATVWEIAIKQSSGKLDAPNDLDTLLEPLGLEALPVTVAHAYAAGFLPRHHNDPFDRMLVAQAAAEGLTIVTRDPLVAAYGVPTLAA